MVHMAESLPGAGLLHGCAQTAENVVDLELLGAGFHVIEIDNAAVKLGMFKIELAP